MSHGNGSSSRTWVAVGLLAVAIGGGLYWLRRPAEKPTPKVVASSADEEVDAPARADPEDKKARAAEARRARDEMRGKIIEVLRKKNAELPKKAQAARPASTTNDPPVKGRYEPAYIQKNFREDMFPLIKQCYESALKRKPQLAGRLILNFTLVGDPEIGGVVEDADIDESSDLNDSDMELCVRESLMTLTLDKPPEGGGTVTVKYPILFSPGDDDAGADNKGDAAPPEREAEDEK